MTQILTQRNTYEFQHNKNVKFLNLIQKVDYNFLSLLLFILHFNKISGEVNLQVANI